MRIGLHADGGRSVGLGHLGRCAALAQAFRSLGAEPVFLDAPAECRPWLAAKGFRSQASGSTRRDVIVADSYRLTPARLRKLRGLATTFVVVDDFGAHAGPCDWILNGHLYAAGLRFKAKGGPGLLLGPKFLPLRREYWTGPRPRKTASRVKNLLLTLGGMRDGGRLDEAIAAARAALPGARLHAVVSPLADAPKARGVILHRAPASLRPLLETCDAVVCAGGQTLYEAAFAGAPSVGVELGPDQAANLESMEAAGAAIRLGKPGSGWTSRLARTLRALDRDPARRARMSASGQAAVDGRGALRVARVLLGDAR